MLYRKDLKMTNKYLEKIARLSYGENPSQIFAKMKARNHSNKAAITGAGIGAVGGAALSSGKTTEDYRGRKKELSSAHRAVNMAVGGLLGGALGYGIGKDMRHSAIHNRVYKKNGTYDKFRGKYQDKRQADFKKRQADFKKQFDDAFGGFGESSFRRGGSGYTPPPRQPSSSFSDLTKKMGMTGTPTTKAEVHKHFKVQAMKHHPDRGGDPTKMTEINSAYTKAKAHPDFEKLASYNKYLEKIAEQF
jgi:hypothetical protein